jgi:hypothetical protein
MDRKITTWCIGVLITLFAFPSEYSYSSIKKPMLDSVYYYLKIDTANIHTGYLRMDTAGVNMKVDNVKGDYAMWNIKKISGDGNRYVLVNKMSSDTLKFAPPSTVEDTIATKAENGILRFWDDMEFNEGISTIFHTSYKEELVTHNFYLTFSSERIVNLSLDTLNHKRMNFIPERVTVLPDPNKSYRIVVDTLGIPDVSDVFKIWNVLATDILRTDSIIVTDTLSNVNFALWKFKTEFILNDTTFFQIRNKATDSILAFEIPVNDTIAYLDTTGFIRHWGLPFFIEEGNKGLLMVRDTTDNKNKDYYLMLKDSIVWLTSDKTQKNLLKFALVEESFKTPFFDTTAVYSVKYMKGDNTGKYLASNDRGDTLTVDKVYAHIPDGQFVVSKYNNYHLTNRLGGYSTTAKGVTAVTSDSLKIVCNIDSIPIRNWFTNGHDTVEITPITSGNIESLKLFPSLGYKSFTTEELSDYSYMFSNSSVDSISGRIMGYNIADSTVVILAGGDTARFTLQYRSWEQTGAEAIGSIPRIARNAFSLRSFDDTTLYVKKDGSGLAVDTIPASMAAKFFLKEDTLPNHYFFVEYDNAVLPQYKLLINSSKQLNFADIDSTDTHSFLIISQIIFKEEPDTFKYLTKFPDELKGKGYYDLLIEDPLTTGEKWLTKNFYDYAVLGEEGGSMLRAGSFTPSDLHLWVDTARGTGFNPQKPSFYFVNVVDTSDAGTDNFNIEGYFLHVIDSLSLDGHEKFEYEDDEGNKFFRANFVKAKRKSTNELLLNTGGVAQLRDSVGYVGKNENAINEYRFFLQESGVAGKYYIVTEAGYGDGGKTIARGYLSLSPLDRKIYFGPRDGDNVAKVSFTSETVSNEIVKPPVIEEVDRNIYVIGGAGQIAIRNAMGQDVVVYNILGQPIAKKKLLSDNESISASRGIAIVKFGTTTKKVVVR